MNQLKLVALIASVAGVNSFQCIDAQEAARKPESAAAVAAEKTGRVTRVSELLNLEVLNEAGESYGIIEDLMLNKTTGQVEFILVSAEKNSAELYPLPWRTVTLYQGTDAKDQYVILGMPREQFIKAPTITREQLPTITYLQWNAYVPKVTTFYGQVRPAEARAIRSTERAIRRSLD